MSTRKTTTARILAATALAAGLVLTPVAAFAHVSVDPSTDPLPGSSTTLTFGINHGCDGSPTTKVAVSMPEGLSGVHPITDANWTIDVERGGDAGRVSTVTYTALTPIPADQRGEVKMQVGLTDDAAGELIFPVEQSCQSGSISWNEVAEDGQDPHDVEAPAPTLQIAQPDAEQAPAAEGSDSLSGVELTSLAVSSGAAVISVIALITALGARRRR